MMFSAARIVLSSVLALALTVAPALATASPVRDPEPRSRGIGAIIGGWITTGAGVALVASGLQLRYGQDIISMYGDDTQEERDLAGNIVLGFGGAALAAGLITAIVGHTQLDASRREHRAWQERRGVSDLQISPVLLRKGGGAMLSMKF